MAINDPTAASPRGTRGYRSVSRSAPSRSRRMLEEEQLARQNLVADPFGIMSDVGYTKAPTKFQQALGSGVQAILSAVNPLTTMAVDLGYNKLKENAANTPDEKIRDRIRRQTTDEGEADRSFLLSTNTPQDVTPEVGLIAQQGKPKLAARASTQTQSVKPLTEEEKERKRRRLLSLGRGSFDLTGALLR